jgi:hypothetical protein
MEMTPREESVVRQAFQSLGGEQSIDSVREWIKVNAVDCYDHRKIGTMLRGCSDLEKARNRHPNFPKAFLTHTRQGHFKLAK